MNATEGEEEQEQGVGMDWWMDWGRVTSTAYKIVLLIIKIKQLLIRVGRGPNTVLPGCVWPNIQISIYIALGAWRTRETHINLGDTPQSLKGADDDRLISRFEEQLDFPSDEEWGGGGVRLATRVGEFCCLHWRPGQRGGLWHGVTGCRADFTPICLTSWRLWKRKTKSIPSQASIKKGERSLQNIFLFSSVFHIVTLSVWCEECEISIIIMAAVFFSRQQTVSL